MTPPPDDDLDWLYGRDRKPAAEPEHTQVIPTTPSPPSSRRVGAPSGSPVWDATAVHPVAPPAPASDPSRPDYRSDQPIYRDQPPPRVQPVSPPPPLGPGGPGQGSGGSGRPPKKRHPARNTFRVLGVLVLVFIVGLVAIPVYAWSQVNRVDEAPSGDRPDKQPGTTYLLVGSDSREGLTKEERKKLGTGSTGGQRTDTIMIMYVPPGGKPALISIPRDSFRPIPGHGSNKINAAFSFGGAPLLVETVEQSTGLRIDNYVEIGFGGFVNIIEAVGGIEMCLPKAIKDKNSHLNLPKGCQTLDGTTALGYVRMRYADPLGDLGRVQRQRAMVAAVADKALSLSTVLNPVRYWNVCTATANALTLGQDTGLLDMGRLALAMRKVSGDQGLTLTVPISDSGASTSAGSAVLWNDKEAKKMFSDIARGDTSGLAKYAK